jgi:omega-amidase
MSIIITNTCIHMTVTICCSQIASAWEDPETTLDRCDASLREAAEQGADIVCFPEQFATGWDPAGTSHIQTLDGSLVTRLSEMARDHALTIVGALRERTSGHPRNTCVVLGPSGGILATYAKIHLFSPGKEDTAYSAGDALATFTVGDLKFGLAICYDLRFNDLFTAYRHLDVDGVIVPAAWPCSRIDQWEILVRARALEHQYYVAGANCTGNTPAGRYCGRSLVAGPSGEILASGNDGNVQVYATLDRSVRDRARASLPVVSDRREDLYKALLKMEEE